MSDSTDTNWNPRKNVLSKVDISREILEDCIKMGILPKPIVKKPGADQENTNKIWYFPKNIVERIEMVKRLKSEGHSMEEIAKKIKKISPVVEIYPDQLNEENQTHQEDSVTPELSGRIADKSLTVTIDDIHSPAYLVNYDFEIEWINPEAENQIFKRSVRSINKPESRNIFKLFFSWESHQHLRNWEELIAFHMKFFKIKLPKRHINILYNEITENEINFLKSAYDKEDSLPKESIHNFPINFVLQDGSIESFRAYSMFFREGIFFVYVPADRIDYDIMDILSHRKKIINELLTQRMPSLVSLCVLVADLQDSVKISAELLPEEYFELINQLWKTLGSSFDKYNGIHGKHAGDGMLYYFIQKPGSNYIMDAINCALELREKMMQFSNEWKIRKGWHNDLYLNIGINEGQEFFGTIRSASNLEFTVLGDSINYAGRLSDFARFGAIWTTKNVISKLDREEIKKIRFGVHRKEHGRELFIQSSFSRVIDLLDKDDKNYSKFIDIAMLPVTEIYRD